MRDNHRMRDQIELRLDNRQIVSFVIGSLVVLGVVFALGVLVGKQLSAGNAAPALPQDPLAAIDAREQIARAAAQAPDAGVPAAVEGDETLTYADELTKPRHVDPAIEPMRPPTPASKAKPEKREPEPRVEPAPAVAQGGSEPVETKAAGAAEPDKRRDGLTAAFDKASGAARPAAAGDFAIQVAALPTRGQADREVSRLTGKGLQAYVVEADIAGKGRVFRVRVGAYGSRAEADTALAGFKKKGSLKDAIVTSAR